jgi:methionyl-tRNA formyltransferase
MIHLLGHNQIVINLANTLYKRQIPFKVYSTIETEISGNNFIKVDNTVELKKLILADINKRLIISAGAPWIFNDEFLSAFDPIGIFNIHGTPLPQDKGGTIVSWLILNKKRLGNSIIHKIVREPDAGPVLMSKEFIYPASCHFPFDYLNEYNKQQEILATELCLEWIEGNVDLSKVSEQPHYLSTYWPRLKTNLNAWINWSWTGNDIELFVRAFDEPYLGALTNWRGKQIHLKKCFFQHDAHFHPFQFGLVYRVRKTDEINYLAIAVEGGTLYCEDCKDENGNSLMHKIKEGDRFQTTDSKLFEAQKRTVKTKQGLSVQSDF